MKKQISILGCGWLGLPLALKLIKNDFSINGSTTTSSKLQLLQNHQIHPFLISLEANEIAGNINKFLENSEILIIDIPPKLRYDKSENFVSKIQNLIPYIEISAIKKVIFVSSTSVYNDDNLEVDETTILNPKTESGKQLMTCENLFLTNKKFKSTIIRFGGLVGGSRNPANFLAGRKNIENPDAVINFIHQDDCIGIIEKVIVNNIYNEIFNGVAPFHPSRKNYYFQKAFEMNLALPEFDTSKPSVGKIVSSQKTIQLLDYKFIGII